jgi:hypothetical protein
VLVGGCNVRDKFVTPSSQARIRSIHPRPVRIEQAPCK